MGKDDAVTPAPRPLRVAQVIYSLEVGGLEKVALSLTRALDAQRFASYVVALNGHGPLRHDIPVAADRCLLLESAADAWLPQRPLDVRKLLRIRRFLRHHEIDVVHLHNAAPLFYGGLAARLLRKRPRIIYSEHNQVYRASSRFKRQFRQYLRLADKTIAVSADLQRYLTDTLRVPVTVDVIHNGISAPRYDREGMLALREAYGLGPEHTVIGTAVVLSEQKGLTYLLEAVAPVVRAVPHARFVIAGDGSSRQALEEQARAAGLTPYVKFIGHQREVAKVISAFDIYVLPSLWEGLPLALLEGLALGKPIVATSVGGNPEIVEDGVNGYLVPPREPGLLAAALIRTCSDEPFRRRASAQNRLKFGREFSLSSMVDAHEQLYESIVAEHVGGFERPRLRAAV